jgi:alpha,alpha-trehalose-phosphate synthase [UDP-forming]/trehalose-phosphatase
MAAEWHQLASAAAVVTALDLDGTLVPFAPTPEEAKMSPDTEALIDALIATPGVTCGIVTGRPRELAQPIVDRFPNAFVAAEHGAWRYARGAWEAALPSVPQLAEIEAALAALAKRYPGALVERKSCAVALHWRRVAPESQHAIATTAEVIVDEWLETQPQLERLPGVEALEVRHVAAHKGNALAWLRTHAPAGATVLAIGDDITDEDMFVALRDQDVGVLVAAQPRRTQATVRLPSTDAVHRFLRWMIDARTAREPRGFDEAVPASFARTAAAVPQLIVVSNRLPSSPSGGRGREVGGLVSALVPALERSRGMWLGWSGAERDPGLKLRVDDGDPFSRAQFDYPPTWRERFYAGFCNRCLWPLLHGFVSNVHYVDDQWSCYVEANQAYAKMIAQVAGGTADVWVQDFHLFLVARELRRTGHRGRIGFYLHVPFPPLDIFETMPWASELVAAMLDYDRLGLQCQRWADNYLANVRGLLGSDAEARARDRMRVIGIGIDPDRFAEAANVSRDPNDSLALSQLQLEASLGGRKLILGVDRLDYSKGIPERLEAFARLLERFPEWRNKVSFVQVSVPTRADVPEYGELRSRVEHLVGRINGTYGEADWTPVRYLYRSYDQATLARLYRTAAVGLVTPLRDGMNLVAKEYVAAQDPNDPGVLVLSRFCGAAEQLSLAVITNPFHADGLAADLDAALRMERPERITRHAQLRSVVWRDTAAAWSDAFLKSLRE